MRFTFESLIRTSTLALALSAVALCARAQGVQTGTIRGTVHDPQGLVMAGVTVTMTSLVLQGSRMTTSGPDGTFTVSLLPPGEYDAEYTIAAFTTARQRITVPLGGVVETRVDMSTKPLVQEITVAVRPTPLSTTKGGLNVRHAEVEALAIARDIPGIARLSPSVTDSAPNASFGQLTINGGFGFDNLIMVDGVEVNDSVFAYPQNLYIEDAIMETQTLTSGIPAEYGRFSGGVVNTITRSGGNAFSGSLRINLTNPAWSVETPPEKDALFERENTLNEAWEGTVGGPILRDRLWFFGAARFATTTLSQTLAVTESPYRQSDRDRRWEAKVTGSAAPGHTVQGAYTGSHLLQRDRPSTPDALDLASLISPTQENWYLVGTYRGTVQPLTLFEATYVERQFAFSSFGGTASEPIDSLFVADPIFGGRYNAPSFSAADPEERNNRQFTISATRSFIAAGAHQLKGGYEYFRSSRMGGTELSSTGYVFIAPYAMDGDGNPLLDADGRLMPLFIPEVTAVAQVMAVPDAALNISTNSVFAQDDWAISRHLSASLGVRIERIDSTEQPSGRPAMQAHTIVPRLAASYDIRGDGAQVIQASYGWYTGRAIDTQAGAASSAIHPDLVISVYTGSDGIGRDFSEGFNLGNYLPVDIQSVANTSLDADLRPTTVRELTLSFGTKVGALGYVEGGYIGRRAAHLIEDFIDGANGTTTVVIPGVGERTLTNVVWKNTDSARRVYDALQVQASFDVSAQFSLNGHYTVQLRNEGNYAGEADGAPGIPSPIGNYPEIFNAERHYPTGPLEDFQRHRLRIWAVGTSTLGRAGSLTFSGIWRVESGRPYSFIASVPYSDVQIERFIDAGYPEQPPSFQAVYFGERGAGTFDGYSAIDASINYAIPIFRSLSPYLKMDLFNLFNNQTPIRFNTAVIPDMEGPVDDLGLPTEYLEGPAFGEADDNRYYPAPVVGVTGGRTLRLAFGLRF